MMAAFRLLSQQMMHVWSATGCGGGGDEAVLIVSCEPYPASCEATEPSCELQAAVAAAAADAAAAAAAPLAWSRWRRFLRRRRGPTTQAGRVCRADTGPSAHGIYGVHCAQYERCTQHVYNWCTQYSDGRLTSFQVTSHAKFISPSTSIHNWQTGYELNERPSSSHTSTWILHTS